MIPRSQTHAALSFRRTSDTIRAQVIGRNSINEAKTRVSDWNRRRTIERTNWVPIRTGQWALRLTDAARTIASYWPRR